MSAKPLDLSDPEIDKFVRTRLAEVIAKRDRDAFYSASYAQTATIKSKAPIYTWADLERALTKTARSVTAKERKAATGEWDEP